MSYFNNVRTEEELKTQFRNLLKRYDYRNPENADLIDKIRKEYDERLLKIKRDNGYQTTFEKMSNYIKREVENVQEAKKAEMARIEKLRNHKYTKEEFADAYKGTQFYMRQIIEELTQNDLFTPSIIGHAKQLDNVAFFQWFHAQRISMIINPELETEYNNVREILEYAVRYIAAQSGISFEKKMTDIEDKLGGYFKEYYRICCDKYLDSIEISQYEVDTNKSIKEEGTFVKLITYSTCVSLLLIPTMFMCFAFPSVPVFIFVIIAFLVAMPISRPISNFFLKLNRSTTFTTLGYKKQRARVTQRQEYNKNVTLGSISRLILRLFGF